MIRLLSSFSFVSPLIAICAEMDETSFEFVYSCFGGRDLRRDG